MNNDLAVTIEILEQADQDAQKAMEQLLQNSLYKKKNLVDDAAIASLRDLGLVDITSEGVAFCPSLNKCRKKVYTYLLRKYENDTYLDDNMEEKKIPRGSSFQCVVGIGVASGLSLVFPDDDVTELLDRYGCNRCRGWSC